MLEMKTNTVMMICIILYRVKNNTCCRLLLLGIGPPKVFTLPNTLSRIPNCLCACHMGILEHIALWARWCWSLEECLLWIWISRVVWNWWWNSYFWVINNSFNLPLHWRVYSTAFSVLSECLWKTSKATWAGFKPTTSCLQVQTY